MRSVPVLVILSALCNTYFGIFYLILKEFSSLNEWKSGFQFQCVFGEMFFLLWISAGSSSECCSQAHLWPTELGKPNIEMSVITHSLDSFNL